MKLIPFSSRAFNSPEQRISYFGGISALVGDNDRPLVSNVAYTLYEHGFDIYLGGEIVENAFNNLFESYSKGFGKK